MRNVTNKARESPTTKLILKWKLTMTSKLENINLKIPRRKYSFKGCNLTICPECGSDLIEESSSILLRVKSDSDAVEIMTSCSGSHFCKSCPVVVFDIDKIEQAAKIAIRGDKNLRYIISGIIDFDSIPDNKKHLPIGSDENPVPLVQFLPDLNSHTVIINKPGRNKLCLCGSGQKYKKCCGR
jgi:hypothetical protein